MALLASLAVDPDHTSSRRAGLAAKHALRLCRSAAIWSHVAQQAARGCRDPAISMRIPPACIYRARRSRSSPCDARCRRAARGWRGSGVWCEHAGGPARGRAQVTSATRESACAERGSASAEHGRKGGDRRSILLRTPSTALDVPSNTKPVCAGLAGFSLGATPPNPLPSLPIAICSGQVRPKFSQTAGPLPRRRAPASEDRRGGASNESEGAPDLLHIT